MPEGDTLYKAAATLSVMQGQTVTAFESPLPALASADVIGATITSVESRGKNLLMWFDDSRAIYTHLRMEGSWHLYRPGTPWRKPARRARVVVTTAEWQAVCFNAPTVEWLTAWQVTHHPVLSTLGPDLLAGDDIEAMITALRRDPARPLGEAIMDQRLVAGIGNVYKSELLFIERLDPFAPIGTYSEDTLRHLLEATRKWMHRNLGAGRRQTRWGQDRQRTWVYNRQGDLCAKCNAPIEMRRQGRLGRSTYYCPQCQGVTPLAMPSSAVTRPESRSRGRVIVRGPSDD